MSPSGSPEQLPTPGCVRHAILPSSSQAPRRALIVIRRPPWDICCDSFWLASARLFSFLRQTCSTHNTPPASRADCRFKRIFGMSRNTVINSAEFTSEQKEYLQGFFAGMAQRGVAPFAGHTADGLITSDPASGVA